MARNQRVTKLTKLPQTDVRAAWIIVGKQIGRAIQDGARAARVVSDPLARPDSRDRPRDTPTVARALVAGAASRLR